MRDAIEKGGEQPSIPPPPPDPQRGWNMVDPTPPPIAVTPPPDPPSPWRSLFRDRRADMIRELVALALEKGVELEITDSREGLHIRVPAREDSAK